MIIPSDSRTWTTILRSFSLMAIEGMAAAAAVWTLTRGNDLPLLAVYNLIPSDKLLLPSILVLAAGAFPVVIAMVAIGIRLALVEPIHRLAVTLCPLLISPLAALAFHWRLWRGFELHFLVLVAAATFLLERTLYAAIEAYNCCNLSYLSSIVHQTKKRPRWLRYIPLSLVVAGATSYAVYFSYYTIVYHLNGHSSTYDLGIEENIVWQILHGGPLFASTPIFGTGPETHFSRHATFIAFLVAPIYALSERAETLLILQSVWLGLGAIPLYFLTRRHAGNLGAVVLTFAYLLYAPLHGAHLYDFHFLTLAPPLVFGLLYAIERRSSVVIVIMFVLTIAVREDIAFGVTAIGIYYALAGEQLRTGTAIALGAFGYFAFIKGVIMPPEGGCPSFLFFYKDVLPPHATSFVGVMQTLLLNPMHYLKVLLRADKLAYLLQVLLPVALLPLRRGAALILLAPAAFLTLSAQMDPTRTLAPFMISFQYTSHWTAYIFFAAALALGQTGEPRWQGDTAGPIRRASAIAAIAFAAIATSYQFGAVLQQHTARAGFDDFVFGTTSIDLERRAARDKLIVQIPRDAKVSASERELPHLANRRWAYTLRSGIFDADYVLFSISLPWSRDDDLAPVQRVLQNRSFGVVDVSGPFALLRRGHDVARNDEVLRLIRHRKR